jgi:RNA polymerase sigma-70 factor (ECF subfamily)
MTGSTAQASIAGMNDEQILAALRRGDEQAFVELVNRHHRLMLHVAARYVRTPSVAEEVVQEAWLGVISGLDRFEGRASLTTWIFRIVANRARSRAQREARVVPFSCLSDENGERCVDPDRFLPDGHRWAGHWASAPSSWDGVPDDVLLSQEMLEHVNAAIAELPERQNLVIVMRDVEGFSADEVCSTLGISEANQRVLLHRARSKVRSALESYLAAEPALT